ncbi:10737_t:CDS:10 [Funneliformis geosporum]|uniref:10737_t:CDS:1 n=1 Tax=Funneliformis geosporum TaxID=1117311 RepID=A0A9W4SBU6_9GLOM|nr:10737_t:CDS:10 [Funneliformis geosporum]
MAEFLPIDLQKINQKAKGFDDIVNSKLKAFNIFKTLVDEWMANKKKFARVNIAYKKQLNGKVEQNIVEAEKNELRSKFKKEGKEYEEDIIETVGQIISTKCMRELKAEKPVNQVDLKWVRQLFENIDKMVITIVEIAEILFLIVSGVELRRDDIEKKKNPPPERPKTKQQYFYELNGLLGWELLTESEKEKFKEMIRKSSLESDWKKAIVQKALREIEAELNSRPKISEKDIIETERKRELLVIIKRVHQQKNQNNLDQLLEEAIQQIREELDEIKEAADVGEIELIRKINKLHSSNFYREKGSEIEAIKDQLQTLNPEQFQEFMEQLLNYQAKDNGLNDKTISRNDYQVLAYEKVRDKVDNLREQLNQKLDMEEPEEEQTSLPKWF